MSEALRVLDPGLLSTVQDLGRPHAVASGVPPGGAMDRFAHAAANLIAGNDRTAATIECTVRGARLLALEPAVVAVTGGDFDVRVNGHEAPMWTGLSLREGDELAVGARRGGARAYVAVAGGIAGDRWLGSLSTSLIAQRGGMAGRALIAGDLLSTYTTPVRPPPPGISLAPALRPRYEDHTLRAVAGPHLARLTPVSRQLFTGSPFAVTPDSDRMGYRLTGPHLQAPGDELLSFGLVAGAVQVPSAGDPILLMADHQTAGGYPVVAVVASAWLPVAAQLMPGDELRFEIVELDVALEMRTQQRAALASLA